MNILIKNAEYVVTMDKDRRIIKDGAVSIQDDRIVEVGKTRELEQRHIAEKVIDATHKLVLPGLIDAHNHCTQQMGRGVTDEVFPLQWLMERMYPFEAKMTSEDAYWSVLGNHMEVIRSGTTCFIDPGGCYPDETAKATGESGLRAVVSRSSTDIWKLGSYNMPKELFRESTEDVLRKGEETVRKWNGAYNGRLKATFELRVLKVTTDELCVKTRELANKYEVGIQAHCASSMENRRDREVCRLHRLGVLGPDFLAIHMGWINMKEALLVKEHDVKVVYTPAAQGHYATGGTTYGMIPELLEMGVTVALGSDAATCSNYIDVVRLMWHASSNLKETRLDVSIVPPETALEMATLNGAKAALWDDQIGSLEPGKKADITIFNTWRPEWRPLLNPISNLVYCATGHSADTVIVDGNVLMENTKITTVDEDQVYDKIQKLSEKCAVRAGLREVAKPRWPII